MERVRGLPLPQRKSLQALAAAYSDLRNAGWSEPMYIPDHIDRIQVIEAGSCGVFIATRMMFEGKSLWFATDGEDEYPCRPLLWRLPPPPRSEGDGT